jgi:hypothetical protein
MKTIKYFSTSTCLLLISNVEQQNDTCGVLAFPLFILKILRTLSEHVRYVLHLCNLKGRDNLKILDIDKRTIFMWILKILSAVVD